MSTRCRTGAGWSASTRLTWGIAWDPGGRNRPTTEPMAGWSVSFVAMKPARSLVLLPVRAV